MNRLTRLIVVILLAASSVFAQTHSGGGGGTGGGGAPSGPAGGSLAGTYPNPSIAHSVSIVTPTLTSPSLGSGSSPITQTFTVGTGGVTQYTLVAADSSNPSKIVSNGNGGFGVAMATVAMGGTVEVAQYGVVNCIAGAGGSLAGDFAINDGAGNCLDSGTASTALVSITKRIVGQFLNTVTAGNPALIELRPAHFGTLITLANIAAGASPSGTFNFTGSTLTAPTKSQNDNSTNVATTAYADLAVANGIAGVNPAIAVLVATTAAGNTSSLTYNNGASGIGATFTGANNTATTIDGVTFTTVGQRLLVKNDTQSPSGAFNGIYQLTALHTSITGDIFTRVLDYDTPSDMNNTGAIPVQSGTVNGSTSWLMTAQIVTVGTTPLTFVQFSYAPPLPTTPNNVSQTLTSKPSGGVGQPPAWALPGLVNRALTGTTSTDTILATDQQVVYQQSVALAETLPTATTLAIPNFFVRLSVAAGSGIVTVTPTTWTINGASTLVIRPLQSCLISVDAAGSAWDAACSNPASYTTLANATTTALTAGNSLFLATPGASAGTAATIIPFGNTGTVAFSWCGCLTAPGATHTVTFTLVQSATLASTSPSDTSAVCTVTGTNPVGVVSGSYAATVGTYWEVRATSSASSTSTSGISFGLELTNY